MPAKKTTAKVDPVAKKFGPDGAVIGEIKPKAPRGRPKKTTPKSQELKMDICMSDIIHKWNPDKMCVSDANAISPSAAPQRPSDGHLIMVDEMERVLEMSPVFAVDDITFLLKSYGKKEVYISEPKDCDAFYSPPAENVSIKHSGGGFWRFTFVIAGVETSFETDEVPAIVKVGSNTLLRLKGPAGVMYAPLKV